MLGWVAMSSSKGLPNPGIKLKSLTSPALAGGFFTTNATWEAAADLWITIYNIDNKQGPTLWHRELDSVFCNSPLKEKQFEENIYAYVCICICFYPHIGITNHCAVYLKQTHRKTSWKVKKSESAHHSSPPGSSVHGIL